MATYKIEPKDILNVKGLNTMFISGNIPAFSEADITVEAQLYISDEANPTDSNFRRIPGDKNVFPATVVVKKSKIKDYSDEAILAEVVKELGVKLVK